MTLAGRHSVVIGSAPIAAPVTVNASDYVVAVNGGIANAPIADAWVVNARSASDPVVAGWKGQLHGLMLEQGRGRRLELLVLLEKGEGAVEHTTRRLTRLGVTWRDLLVIHNEERRRLETKAGARDGSMTAHALSAGMFGAAWCFLRGAETVRLEGFSWRGGYSYTDASIATRGHEAGDKQALVRLEAHYGERLIHTLKEKVMAKRHPKTAKATPTSKAAKSAARAATTPAVERARKKAANVAATAERAVAKVPKRLMVKATEMTYYGERRRRAGEVFQLRTESDFRESCMEWADGAKPSPRPTVENARPGRLKPNAADLEDDDAAPAGKPGANNPLGV